MLTSSLHTLQSGLKVVRIAMPAVKSVTTLVLANTGSRYELQDQEGIAHFFEHMVFKGTEKYPDAQAIASSIDAIGANANAFTSKEYTGYYVKSASKHVAKAVDILSDMVLSPQLRQEDIDREKGVIIEEINMYLDTPMHHVSNLFERMVFQGTGLEHDIIGHKETVSNVTSNDFKNLLNRWYGLDNLVLVLAGDEEVVMSSETLELVEEAFSKDGGNRESQVDTSQFTNITALAEKNLHIENKQTEQAHLVLGWSGIKRSDPKKYALSILNVAMGGNMSSRLFTEVREKRGLCYYVHSDADFYHDIGVVGASAGVDPKRVHEAIQVIQDECYAVASKERPLSTEEISRAKEYIAGTMTLALEDSQSVAQHFGLRQLLLGTLEAPEETLKKIQQVTPEEVAALATELYLPGKMKLAVIGPFPTADEFKKYVEK